MAGRCPVQIAHHAGPDGRCAAGAADIPHGCATGVANPYAHGIALGVADGPVVTHIFAGSGFHSAPKPGGQHAVAAKGTGPGVAVGQDVADDKGRARIDHAWGRRCVRTNGHKRALAEATPVGQRTIGVGELEQGHIRATQSQAVAVVVAAFAQRQTKGRELLVKRIGRHHHQGANRRDIERRAQRGTRGDPTLEVVVVVLRDVQAARGLDLRARVIQQRRRGDAPLGNGLGIQKGLERGAWLAQR